jgi:Sap, sulfolipid-1-addressing protein
MRPVATRSGNRRDAEAVPAQALALALAASIYPPAVAAVIALGRGAQVRSRVFAFVFAAALTTYATGALMLLALEELGATGPHNITPSAAIDVALGVGLILLAAYLYRRRPPAQAHPETPSRPSKIARYLESRRLAFVLGVTLYVLPSPIYIAAVKATADAGLSTSGELLALAATVAVMLWLIELPMLMLLVVPARAARELERVNAWFSQNGRMLAVAACAGAGVYLAVRGLVDLID